MAQGILDINKPIRYCEDWAVGIPLIDSQHLRLFEMIEDLRLAVVSQAENAMITKVLKGLVDYCFDHFECEQMLMQTIQYPVYSSHLGLHQQFTDQALRWFAEHQRGKLDLTIVLHALMEWLVSHILDNDKKIAEFCVKKNIDCAQFQSVSDVIPKDSQKAGRLNLPVEAGMVLFMIPVVALFCWLTFWQATPMGRIVAGIALCGVLILNSAMVVYVRRTLYSETRRLHLAHSKQLADNMLASEIAKRIAVMQLDDIDKLFVNEHSPLVGVLQEIVGHLKIYLPYLPESLLALVRGEGEGEGGETEAETEVQLHILEESSLQSLEAVHNKLNVEIMLEGPLGSERGILKVESYSQDVGVSSPDIPGVQAAWDEPRTSTSKLMRGCVRKFSVSSAASSTRSAGAAAGTCLGVPQGPGSSSSSPRSNRYPPASDGSHPVGKRPHQSTVSMALTGGQAVKSSATKARSLLDKWLKKKIVSVLFADISGFNDLANTMPMEQLLAMHSTYVTVLEDVGKATKGTVQSLVGDRVILSWNAASSVAAHAMEACRAALMLRDTLAECHEFSTVRVKVAVGTGSAQVGNIGSKAHLSFSIVGPVMLVTSALCKLNAFLGTDILISSNTWRDVKEQFIAKIVAQVDLSCIDPSECEEAPVESHRRASGGGTSRRSVKLSALTGIAAASEVRRMFALHLLKQVEGNHDGEWMYVLQQQQTGDPFAAYHEAVLNLFYGCFEKGHTGLQEYIKKAPNDAVASELLSMCERADEDEPEFSWIYGWAHP